MNTAFSVVSSTKEGHCFLILASKDASCKIMDALNGSDDLNCIGFSHHEYFLAGNEIFLNCTLFEVTLKEGVKLPQSLYIETLASAVMSDVLGSL